MCQGELVSVVNSHSGDSPLGVKHLPGWKPLLSLYLYGELYLGVSWSMVNNDWADRAQVDASVYHRG